MATLNFSYLSQENVRNRQGEVEIRDNERAAEGGLLMKSTVTITAGLPLYRFASSHRAEESWYVSPWWIGQSPYEAIVEHARVNKISLGQAARICLAVDPTWGSRCDVLVGASVTHALTAWAGTPRTIRSKVNGRYTARWEPDRRVTQLYIPGLTQLSETAGQPIWRVALQGLWHRRIAGDTLR